MGSLSGYARLEVLTSTQDATEPNQGNFTFAAGDVIANLAMKNKQLLRGKFNQIRYLPSRLRLQATIAFGIINSPVG